MSRPIARRCFRYVRITTVALTGAWLLGLSGSTLASAASELVGPYLGFAPPGSAPSLFAPGIVSKPADFEHSAAVFSPDGNEVFWCANVGARTDPPGKGQRMYSMQQVDGVWTDPELAPFTEGIEVPAQRPVFSPDGSRLYFELFGYPDGRDDSNIYVVERDGDGWSALSPVSPLINTAAIERLHCVTADGSLIFSRNPYTNRETVHISRLIDGSFTEPERLGAPFDSAAYELAIVMAADESYMLISTTLTGMEDWLHISYREPDGTWTERIRVPYECGGFLALSPDGEYLFFLGEGIYWVDTSFVERLRPEASAAG